MSASCISAVAVSSRRVSQSEEGRENTDVKWTESQMNSSKVQMFEFKWASEWSQHSAEILVLVLVLCLLFVTLHSWSKVHFISPPTPDSGGQLRITAAVRPINRSGEKSKVVSELCSSIWSVYSSRRSGSVQLSSHKLLCVVLTQRTRASYILCV